MLPSWLGTHSASAIEERLWDLEFQIEVSTRYRDWRRAFIGAVNRWVKALSIADALLAFVALIDWGAGAVGAFVHAYGVPIAAAVVAVVNIFGLAFGFDSLEREHTELYRRFREMQERIARDRARPGEMIDAWLGDVMAIRHDEPPTYWALYAMSWNQSIERHAISRPDHMRAVGFWSQLCSNIVKFGPAGFPLASKSGVGGR